MTSVRSRCLPLATVAIACASCATPDFAPPTDKLLNVAFMKEQFGASAYPDVAAGSQCATAPELSVSVIEDRRGLRMLSSFPKVGVSYEGMAASIQRYFGDALREAKVRTASGGGTAVQVRVEELTMTTGWGAAAGSATFAVSVPQWNHTATYLGEEVSGNVVRGIAYAVHMAVLKFLNDPQVLSRLQCKAR